MSAAIKVRNVVSKNLIPLCVLKILKEHSDINHKLTQEDIIQYLRSEYSIDAERKAIGRTIERLSDEMEIEIGSDKKGCWYEDPDDLEDYELHMIIDSLFTSRYIPKNYTDNLIKKLCSLTNEFFKSHVKYTYSADNLSKNENKSIFTNIEFVDQAIEKSRKLEFDYNKWGVDKKLHFTAHHIVTPYRMIVHNQRYYLMALNEKYQNIVYYRMDHITNMQIIDEPGTSIRKVKGWEGGITNKNMASNLPYMYSDKQETITFYADPEVIDQMVDWLGFDVNINVLDTDKDGKYKLSIYSSPLAMKYFALQYLDDIEILSPQSLRDGISNSIKQAYAVYK